MKIEIDNLSKSYTGEHDVLNNIDFEDNVRTLAVIGRSGCGKSTLLKIFGGLLNPSSGTVSLDGTAVDESPEYRRKVGFVFQQAGLFSHLTAIRNITLPLVKVHGMSEIDAKTRAEELLATFGLLEQADKLPHQLSGGQQQRISIARAVAPKPRILLLDEPTSSLDPEYTGEVLNMVQSLANEDLSFIIATHEMGFALHCCEKVAFMENGNIAEYGDSKEIFTNPRTEQLKQFLSKLLQWKV